MMDFLEENRLFGRTLFLSVDIPTKEYCDENKCDEASRYYIDQAAISLARAVFSEGGNLVIRGDISIIMLMALVASEYASPRFAEGLNIDGKISEHDRDKTKSPISIYLENGSDNVVPEIDLLHQLGYISIHYVAPDEKMRFRLIKESNPVAMICIGGMAELINDFKAFHELKYRSPIFIISGTGGAAGRLARNRDLSPSIREIDRELIRKLNSLRNEWYRSQREGEYSNLSKFDESEQSELTYVPYTLIMQEAIAEVIELISKK